MSDYMSKYTEAEQELALQYQKAYEQKMKDATPLLFHPMPNIPKQPHASLKMVSMGSTFYNNRQYGPVVSQTSHFHGNGFWSEIQITSDDHVRFKLFRGGWFAQMLFMLGRDPRRPDGTEHSWDSIGSINSDANLEVTLGNTYLKIDEIIAEEIGDMEHMKFIKNMAKTDPENLKMIAGLKNLDDGMNEVTKGPPELNGTSQPGTALTFDGAGFLQPSTIRNAKHDPIAEAVSNDIVSGHSIGLDEQHMELAQAIRAASGHSYGPESRDEAGELLAENDGSTP